MFQVFMNGQHSRNFKLNNGLPQGSVLAPLLFNLYIHDLPASQARKFLYADDSAYAIQGKTAAQIEEPLSSDMANLTEYCQNWRLNPSVTKTETSFFHLDNRQANAQLQVTMDGRVLNFNPTPKYLGVTLDRTLTYKQHLTKLRGKLNSRNNITSWGADAKTLKTSAMALVYSTSEYCCSSWLNSHHTTKVDTALNATMRLVSGTVKSTPREWLPALTTIAPSHLRRENALLKEYDKITSSPDTPLFNDLQNPFHTRLKSRKPPLATAATLKNNYFNLDSAWKEQWLSSQLSSPIFDFDKDRKNELTLPRKCWSNLNRLRTGHGCCNYMLNKWMVVDSPECQCGEPNQTTHHMMFDCPLTMFNGTVTDILHLNSDAVNWLKTLKL